MLLPADLKPSGANNGRVVGAAVAAAEANLCCLAHLWPCNKLGAPTNDVVVVLDKEIRLNKTTMRSARSLGQIISSR